MANETFKDYDGNKKYRKTRGAGTSGDPAIAANDIDQVGGASAAALADNTANPTVHAFGSFVMVYDGATWDRWQGGVTISGSLPAGTNNIGDVDVASVPADPFGTNGDASSATGSISAKLRYLAAGIAGMTSLPAGTNAIGKLAANTGVTIGAVEIASSQTLSTVTTVSTVTSLSQFGGQAITLGAGAVGAGTVRMTLASDDPAVAALGNILAAQGGTLTVKRVKISAAASGENTLVAAVAAKKIRVLSLFLMATADVNAYFNNSTDGGVCGDSTNKLALKANSGFVLPENRDGWFETGTANEALRINLSGAVGVAGSLTYAEV